MLVASWRRSRGRLLNLRGEVVGIHTQIYDHFLARYFARPASFTGKMFAIPIDLALDVQNQLRATGRVIRGRIGMEFSEVNKELANSFGLAKPQGALVNTSEKGGPAHRAGASPKWHRACAGTTPTALILPGHPPG